MSKGIGFTQSHRVVLGAALLGVLMAAGVGPRPVFAHEAKCPICSLDVPQDTTQQDNEVAIRSGRKRIEYRCVSCALHDAVTYKGDITVLAPSDVKGQPVLLTRKDGSWSSTPANVLFVGQKVPHASCPLGYRVFTTRAAFDAWTHKNHALLGDATPLSLPQMIELSK